MSKCERLPREFAKLNARNFLLKDGIIDKYNNILDHVALGKARATFRNYAMKEYGLDATLVLNEDIQGSNKVVFNQAAFRAIDILRGTISEDQVRDVQTQGYLNQARAQHRATTLFEPAFNDTFFNEPSPLVTPKDNVPVAGMTNLYILKESLLARANDRLTKIKPLLKVAVNDRTETKRLLKLQTTLKEYIEGNPNKNIEGLENELEALAKIDSRAPEIIAPFITKELDRLQELTNSSDPDQVSEARVIVDFVKSMGDFTSQSHPFFHPSELWDRDSNFLLTDAMVQPFKDWRATAEFFEEKLNAQNRNIIETVFNNNDKITKMFANRFVADAKGETHPFTYEEVTQGRKDAAWIDSMIMDISSGIMSHNGLLPQVIRNVVDNEFEQQYSWSKAIQEKIDHQTPAVQEELKKMGYNLTNFGFLGVNGVSFDLFKQMIPNSKDQSTGNIVDKYSVKWFEDQGEMKDAFSRNLKLAKDVDDPDVKRLLFDKAIQERNAWYAANTQIVNPAMLSAIVNNPDLSSLSSHFTASPAEMEAHQALLEKIAGKAYINKITANQTAKLNNYIVQRDLAMEEIMGNENVATFEELSTLGKRQFEIWDAEKNPFLGVAYRANPIGHRVGSISYHSKFDFNESIPLEGKDYYDTNYAQIEANPVLSKFYDTIYEATSGMRQRFPYDIQQKMLATSIPHLKQSIMEILTDKHLTAMQALSKAFRQIIDNIKALFGIREEDTFSYAKINPTTGLPDYKVNDSFIKQNQSKINDLFAAKKVVFQDVAEYSGRITRFTSVPMKLFSLDVLEKISEEYMGKKMSAAELKTEFGENLPIGKILYRASQHQVAQEKSFDLPKVIKMYTHLSAQYIARQEMLPLVELMKDHYQKIGKSVTNNMGDPITNAKTKLQRIDGARINAVEQSEDWFKRVVLGDFGLKKQYGKFGKEKIYTAQEETQIEELDKAIETLGKTAGKERSAIPADDPRAAEQLPSEADLAKLIKIREDLGKEKSLSAVVDSVMTFIRFKGLGFNLSSGITNFIEGQVANSVQASGGHYFPPEYIYTVSVSDMVAGDLVKQFNPAMQSEATAKASFLAEAGDVMQDNSNELQKASTKTAFSALKRLNPYYITAKTEQYNQIPLMVATLRNAEIIGINGEVGNVWDALQGEYHAGSKEWTAKLKPEYDTEANRESWHDFKGRDYMNWKSTIKQVIANTHGDFSDTGGMRAKSYQIGQAFLMFKSWLPKELYKIYATQQDDILTGVKGFKGRWRSHTPVSAAVQGAVMGTYAFGLPGAAIGAGVGYIAGSFGNARSNISVMQELSLTVSLLARKMAGMPVNLVGSFIPGVHKNLINTQLSDSHFKSMQGPAFSKVDFNNFRANMQHLSMMLSFMGLLLLTKALTWDDDDDQESMRRKIHNILANRFMQLSSAGLQYANLTDMSKTATPAIVTFSGDVGKLLVDFGKMISGDDTLQTGVNAGESRTYNQLKKVALPGIIAHPISAGFASQTERQFVPSTFDSWFFGEEKEAKKEIKNKKSERKRELSQNGSTEAEIKATINKEFPRRGKEESYKQQLDRVIDLEPDDE